MSNVIRENEIDVDEIRATMTPQHVQDALEGVQDAQRALWALRKVHVGGKRPEIVRALDLVELALTDALDESPDPMDEVGKSAMLKKLVEEQGSEVVEVKMVESPFVAAMLSGKTVIFDEVDAGEMCQHCGATIEKGKFLCDVCREIEEESK